MTSRGLADTTVFIAQESGRALDASALPDEVAVSVITIGELRAGVLAASDATVRERRLRTYEAALQVDPIVIDGDVADAWARLLIMLRDDGRRMPVNDSWIAATALALHVPVITQDHDFPDLPGLDVIRV